MYSTRASCGVGALVDLNGRCTHQLVEDGLTVLVNLDHRGARGAEEKTGDGAGLLAQIPHDFFRTVVPGLGNPGEYGVGQVFFPRPEEEQRPLKKLMEALARQEGLHIKTWRVVPTDNTGLGETALRDEPAVLQFFVEPDTPDINLDAALYVYRRVVENTVAARAASGDTPFYICSLSRHKIVYKGLLTCAQLATYYPELRDSTFATRLLLVHSRFSTNTLGAWQLAHPYRCIVHNGEFNTLRGNLNWMTAREGDLACETFGSDIDKLKPVVHDKVSDSAIFDGVLELLLESGRSLPHALRMMVPEAWHRDALMDAGRKSFYEYHSTIMEPWDGPALVVATDGIRVAAILDRNGLRPCRYTVTRDHRLVLASETGVLDIPPEEVVTKGRLRPGQLLLADSAAGQIVPEAEIFQGLVHKRYSQWLSAGRVRLADLQQPCDDAEPAMPQAQTAACQRAFGYTLEQLQYLLQPMAEEGKDPIGSMGNDAPPAALSTRRKSLFQYFQQLFAQVSNPPLDYLRESLVTSLASHIGKQRNLLAESAEHCRQLLLDSPVLDAGQWHAIQNLDLKRFPSACIDITFSPGMPLRDAIERICTRAAQAVADGAEIVLVSDRDVGPERMAIPSLLATGALHHHLIRQNLRTRTALVLDSGEPCLVHHLCTLIGYGADAVHPWLAYQSILRLAQDDDLPGDAASALHGYRKALEGGMLKVMAKMGISTLQSYKGAQVFEVVGLDTELVDTCFEGTVTHAPGIGLEQLEKNLVANHHAAWAPRIAGNLALEQGGELYWRRDGEYHQWNPYTIGKLQQAARSGNREAYRAFARSVNRRDEHMQALRGLLELDTDTARSIPLEEVESCDDIMRRFATGSMSFGALSREAHETLAIAMNRIGGKAGSGEGGEQPDRFATQRECSMKQVASGRFGVTIHYLSQARQIEIKMAQGSKPGEGGELPGGKVNDDIAAVRFTTPGVGLISPPPHHDIYSIEDLAQLIHDLKCANPEAEIHVKLVALGGVGTIAAGVAKGRADAVLISGDSGGTGASVKTSIKSAGLPWEIGLAETQQVLLANNLRSRIRVRVDGGLKTGRDVLVAALLGAEEFGFGTAPLVTLGCIMLRKCHCNTCSVGVATQDPALRARFTGRPEHVVTYLRFVAEEVREGMAALGYRRMDEMVGQVDRLRMANIEHPNGAVLDLSRLLVRPQSRDTPYKTREQDHKLANKADHALMEQAAPALERGEPVSLKLLLRNQDRTVGTMLSWAVARRYGGEGLSPGTIRVTCTGSAGQSFGAFLARGIALHLEGDANDYVGKGLSGGLISIRTPASARFNAAENILIGNVSLYGATSGEAYFNGLAGERFAVRNSGAMAVVEGVGDHACEYMTGGVVVVLGITGRNIGAGMSGGEAYILDPGNRFDMHLNTDSVRTRPIDEKRDRAILLRLLENHVAYTDSQAGKRLLEQWPNSAGRFVKVVPDAYAAIVEERLRSGGDIRPAPPPVAAQPANPP